MKRILIDIIGSVVPMICLVAVAFWLNIQNKRISTLEDNHDFQTRMNLVFLQYQYENDNRLKALERPAKKQGEKLGQTSQ